MRLCVEAGRHGAMCRCLCDDAFPDLMARTGILACHLFSADASASYVDTAESSTRPFDVPPWVLVCEAGTTDAADEALRVFDGAFSRLGVEVREDLAVYALEICRLAA